MNTGRFTVTLDDEATATAVAMALAPEADESPEGTRTTVRSDGADITVDIQADDLSGMRAAMNSALRLLDAARRAASG